MKAKLRLTIATIISALTLSACQTSNQTPDLSKQTSQTTNMPTVVVNLDRDGDGVPDSLDDCPNTSENVVVDKRGCGIMISLIGLPPMMEYRAFFAKGSSELLPKYLDELDRVAEQMNNHDTATIKIEAHVSEDEVGEISTSILQSNTLAMSRALNVKNYLILKHQVDPKHLITLDCGTRGPIAPSDTEEGRSMNRRVYGLVSDPKAQKDNYYQSNSNLDRCIEF